MVASLHIVQVAAILLASANAVTIEEVQQHGSPSDCWSAIYGKVYDLTNYGASHSRGGGPQQVWDGCGIDYTDDFDQVHGDTKYYLQWDGIVEIGDLTVSSPPSTEASTQTTAAQTTESPPTVESSTSTTYLLATTMTTKPAQVTTIQQTQGTTEPPLTTTTPNPAVDITSEQTQGTTEAGTMETISPNELALHDNSNDCWLLFYDSVYDLTEYAYRHPVVGEAVIHPYCGMNGTDAFASNHDKSYLDMIEDLFVGTMAEDSPTTEPPASETVVSDKVLAEHDSPQDCWVAFYESVYDMTQYAYTHPGPGEEAIHQWCGLDGTTAFDAFHQQSLLSKVEYAKVGSFSTSSASVTKPMLAAVLCGVTTIII